MVRSRAAGWKKEAPEIPDFVNAATAASPTTYVNISGMQKLALCDTGAQVSTMNPDVWSKMSHLYPLQEPPAFFRMSAANGTDIPYLGFVMMDLVVDDTTVKDAILF